MRKIGQNSLESNTTKESSEKNLYTHHLQAVGKLKYAKGSRPSVKCIFCAVRDEDPRVTSLKIYDESELFICLNLYPYNPGHLMVIPKRHLEDFADLTESERNRLFEIIVQCQQMLSKLFHPSGFNVGYNQGEYSGASVNHIHVHIVPRYKNELGYIDIIGSTKIVVQPVSKVFQLLKSRIHEYIH